MRVNLNKESKQSFVSMRSEKWKMVIVMIVITDVKNDDLIGPTYKPAPLIPTPPPWLPSTRSPSRTARLPIVASPSTFPSRLSSCLILIAQPLSRTNLANLNLSLMRSRWSPPARLSDFVRWICSERSARWCATCRRGISQLRKWAREWWACGRWWCGSLAWVVTWVMWVSGDERA